MVEVFRTDVHEQMQAARLTDLLHAHFPGSRISFDLEDCDHVLRVEGEDVSPQHVSVVLHSVGCLCEILY